jgi:hypothetical protein
MSATRWARIADFYDAMDRDIIYPNLGIYWCCKTFRALPARLRQIEAKPEIRKYKSKRLTERTPKAQRYVPSPARSGSERINACSGIIPSRRIAAQHGKT